MPPETQRTLSKTSVEPFTSWRANRRRPKRRDGQRRKFFETLGRRRGNEQSTNEHGNQFEAAGWLPECDIARNRNSLSRKRRLQTADKQCTSVNLSARFPILPRCTHSLFRVVRLGSQARHKF